MKERESLQSDEENDGRKIYRGDITSIPPSSTFTSRLALPLHNLTDQTLWDDMDDPNFTEFSFLRFTPRELKRIKDAPWFKSRDTEKD